ncbi:hypothetical protein [Pseudooceanicola atlanticus]|uniref:Uncharacterized protein n=1 Tax=Pseudooceanicola atlanticus TaxID=1461694 RepID=A0A0A0EI59_9RHOB|nr:hypothetical protein [Pseudooceanicola atlanticus]KGM50651.1 hypothetical protein ATO9_04030 [Pseudooceanicola atlanticus]
MGMQMRKLAENDLRAMIAAGTEMAQDMVRSDVKMDESHVMWALLCEAADVSSRAFTAPPRTGFPAKSAMPDAPDDVSYWHLMMAYIKGEVEDAPSEVSAKPIPSSQQIDRATFVLDVWHGYALSRKGAKSRLKKAVYLKACGVRDRSVCAATGLSKQALHAAKKEAMRDMWEAIRRY